MAYSRPFHDVNTYFTSYHSVMLFHSQNQSFPLFLCFHGFAVPRHLHITPGCSNLFQFSFFRGGSLNGLTELSIWRMITPRISPGRGCGSEGERWAREKVVVRWEGCTGVRREGGVEEVGHIQLIIKWWYERCFMGWGWRISFFFTFFFRVVWKGEVTTSEKWEGGDGLSM